MITFATEPVTPLPLTTPAPRSRKCACGHKIDRRRPECLNCGRPVDRTIPVRGGSAAIAALQAQVDQLRSHVADLSNAAPRDVVVRINDQPAVTLENECLHSAFTRVMQLAAIRKPVFLPGPTGCGKSHLAEQVAKAIGLRFAFVSCSSGMSEGQLTGRLLPTGAAGKFEYVISQFVDLYEHGGVFLVDEIDAADANVLLVMNAALANGKMALTNRPDNPVAYRHPDFVCIAGANTFGHGASREYCGRNSLDQATLDRFRYGTVEMDYDATIERSLVLARGGSIELYEMLARYRAAIRSAKLHRPLSTRFMLDAADAMALLGDTLEDVSAVFFQGWRDDEKAKVINY